MYRVACILTSIVCLILFGLFAVVPGLYTAGYGVDAGPGGEFFGRRLSPMVLGLAVTLWLLRDHADVAVRRAVSLAMVVIFAGVAVTGVFAFATDVAGQTILVAATGELVIAAAFFVAWMRG